MRRLSRGGRGLLLAAGPIAVRGNRSRQRASQEARTSREAPAWSSQPAAEAPPSASAPAPLRCPPGLAPPPRGAIRLLAFRACKASTTVTRATLSSCSNPQRGVESSFQIAPARFSCLQSVPRMARIQGSQIPHTLRLKGRKYLFKKKVERRKSVAIVSSCSNPLRGFTSSVQIA